jgi:hypothetical protein
MSIESDETAANFESILSGKLPAAELVIGLVGAVGADLRQGCRMLYPCPVLDGYLMERAKPSGQHSATHYRKITYKVHC